MAKTSFMIFVSILFLLCWIAPGRAANPAGFESIKSLVGDWTGKSGDGSPVKVNFQLVSGGTAVMETMHAEKEDMVTMYYPDGSNVMMTHYCMANNQPRMRASGTDASKLSFEYVDATNLSSAEAGHMKGLMVTMKDKDHISETWTWSENGQEKSDTFPLERVK
jgi:hypothetical protein